LKKVNKIKQVNNKNQHLENHNLKVQALNNHQSHLKNKAAQKNRDNFKYMDTTINQINKMSKIKKRVDQQINE
jgi:hypothetical protein